MVSLNIIGYSLPSNALLWLPDIPGFSKNLVLNRRTDDGEITREKVFPVASNSRSYRIVSCRGEVVAARWEDVSGIDIEPFSIRGIPDWIQWRYLS
jgi:hypothetical protein